MLRFILPLALLVGCSSSGLQNDIGTASGAGREASTACPAGSRYAPNGSGQGYCVFDDLRLPAAEVSAYCDYVEDGYLGFHWNESELTVSYECPAGFRRTDNGAGTGFCVADDLNLPETAVAAYCNYLEDGYLGFSWDLCPEAARYAENGEGTAFCLFEDLVLPEAPVYDYCDYLEDGYLGFSYDEDESNASYVCPDGFRQASNGQGHTFCLSEDVWMPTDTPQAYCDYLDDGVIGFSWAL
jgi:hypothetical protein